MEETSTAACNADPDLDDFVKVEVSTTIPLEEPICLRGFTGNILQNEFFWTTARCVNQNTKAWEQLTFKAAGGKKQKGDTGNIIAILSRWNNRYLTLRDDSFCAFSSSEITAASKFMIEIDPSNGLISLISALNGCRLEVDSGGYVRCLRREALESSTWEIVLPTTTTVMTQEKLRKVTYATARAVALPVAGVAALVTLPMTGPMITYGRVLASLGAIYAPVTMARITTTSVHLFVREAIVIGKAINDIIYYTSSSATARKRSYR